MSTLPAIFTTTHHTTTSEMTVYPFTLPTTSDTHPSRTSNATDNATNAANAAR